jgi:hypothetical protein
MQQVNLYNPAFEKRRELLSLPGLAVAWSAAVLLVALALIWSGMRSADLEQQLSRATADRVATQAQLVQLTAQSTARQADTALQEQLLSLQADLASRKQVVTTLGNGAIGDTRGFSEHFRAFARQSFDGLWLTGVSVSNAGRDVVLQGRALAPDSVPGYVQRLNKELVMRGHTFAELEMHRPDAKAAEAQAALPAFIEFRLATAPQVREGAGN